MALLNISRSTKSQDKKIAQKAQSTRQAVRTVKGGGVASRINEIKLMVEKNLGRYADEYAVIDSESVLHSYIDACIKNKYISIDTETTGLDPLVDKLVGICIYTYDEKGAYIPLNHVSYVTGVKATNQLDADFVVEEFNRLLKSKPDIDMFNAKFDIRFLRANGLNDIYCTYDGYLASKLMNENEPTHGLKALHKKYVLNGEGDAFSFDELFKGITFDLIPIQTGYLYAAHDPVITTELCDYQRKYMYYDKAEKMDSRNGMNGVAWVFYNIEMPCIDAVSKMEDTGVAFDMEYAQLLSEKYHKLLLEKEAEVQNYISVYEDKIDAYVKSHSDSKLDRPINISSPTQLSVLFYDILKFDVVDKKNPRGTGEPILSKLDNPICKALLEYREVNKLLSTYIDKLPECVNQNDGRIHCKFNQYGADTGRMSSQDPNLQNIPSHNKEVRKMFTASEGYVLMSSDFSQQEPKCLAALCKKAGDSQMYDTFMAGKDLYSEIASKAFNVEYEDCKEFNADGSTNKKGKERRTQAKSILLGVLYGRGEKSIAEQLNCSEEKAKSIKQSVFRGFPAIKQFEQDSLDMAYELGYVTTVCGRKRRLPDLQLDEYEFIWKGGAGEDLLDFDSDVETEVPEELQKKYLRKLAQCRYGQKKKIFEQANAEGIWIIDNGGKIADATRQCVNARIQGSAADLTKLAMIRLNDNEQLKKLGFRLLIPVHDEIIAECPEENAKECSELLADVMSKSAEEILRMPIKCDVAVTRCWYGEELQL